MTEAGQDSQFGKFLLRDKLGAGGMAEVHLAEMSGLGGFGKLVALKRILPHLNDDQDFITALISEARLGGSLNHPNIVQTLDIGVVAETHYLALEYVPGVTLTRLIKARQASGDPFPLPVVLDIGRQLCEGLAYAHSATDPRGNPLHMIHRDLKPDNILISQFGVVKISDFGVAKAATNLLRTESSGIVKGTVAYMSPEQARSETLDHRSDLYSLGAILFELLALERLYPKAYGVLGLLMVEKSEISYRLEALETYPRTLVEIVAKLLEKDREQRPGSALEVSDALVSVEELLPRQMVNLGALVRLAMESPPPTGPRSEGSSRGRGSKTEASITQTYPPHLSDSPEGASSESPEQAHGSHKAKPRSRLLFPALVLSSALILALVGGWLVSDRFGGTEDAPGYQEADTLSRRLSSAPTTGLLPDETREGAFATIDPQTKTLSTSHKGMAKPIQTPPASPGGTGASIQTPPASPEGAGAPIQTPPAARGETANPVPTQTRPEEDSQQTSGLAPLPGPSKPEASPEHGQEKTGQAKALVPEGYLRLNVKNADFARVYFRDRLIGATPLRRAVLPEGTHTLRLEANDGRVEEVVVTIERDKMTTKIVTMGDSG